MGGTSVDISDIPVPIVARALVTPVGSKAREHLHCKTQMLAVAEPNLLYSIAESSADWTRVPNQV